jgi:hypothetical protein
MQGNGKRLFLESKRARNQNRGDANQQKQTRNFVHVCLSVSVCVLVCLSVSVCVLIYRARCETEKQASPALVHLGQMCSGRTERARSHSARKAAKAFKRVSHYPWGDTTAVFLACAKEANQVVNRPYSSAKSMHKRHKTTSMQQTLTTPFHANLYRCRSG